MQEKRATNQCKCLHYLHQHKFVDGRMKCKKCRKCKEYDH